MEIKNISPMHMLYFSTETKVTDLAQYVGVIGERLKKDAETQGLTIVGDQYWLYDGFDGDENKFFTLEIAYPIAALPANYSGDFATKTLPDFRCVSIIHQGHWLKIPESYGKIMGFVQENELQPTAKNREIYTAVDMNDFENNVTEIQLGIN